MKYIGFAALAVGLLAASALSQASSATLAPAPIEIRGHRVGETILQFLTVEKAQDKLTHCRDQLLDSTLVARVTALKQCMSQPLRKGCMNFLADAELQTASAEMEECLRVASVINGGSEKLGAKVLNMSLPGSASFDHGKLVEMDLDFWNLPGNGRSFAGGYDAVLLDFIAKLGTPTKVWSDEFQNGFGARFSYRRAAWETDAVTVLLTELESHDASSVMRDRAFFQKAEQDEAAKHKNVLDR
jgi:hypothetical protein